MKRALTTLLAAGLLVFLAACGGNGSDNAPTGGGNNPPTAQETPQPTETPTTEQETETAAQEFSIGEAVETDWLEFTLVRFEFAELVSNITAQGGEPFSGYMLPTSTNPVHNPSYAALDGQILVSFDFNVQNIGRRSFDSDVEVSWGNFPPPNQWAAMGIGGGITIEYGDGIIFGGDDRVLISLMGVNNWISGGRVRV